MHYRVFKFNLIYLTDYYKCQKHFKCHYYFMQAKPKKKHRNKHLKPGHQKLSRRQKFRDIITGECLVMKVFVIIIIFLTSPELV